MSVQTEIQNKEKILSELMTRILKIPLDPIDESIKKMQNHLLDAQDRLQTIDDVVVPLLTVLAEGEDKASKHSKKVLTKIQEDIQSLNFQVKEHIEIAHEDQRHALESLISEHAIQNNLSLKSTVDDIIKERSETTVTLCETLSSVSMVRQELNIAIENRKIAQSIQMEATLKEIRFAKEFSEKKHASLATKIEDFNNSIAAKLETLSKDNIDSLAKQQKIKQEISEIITFNHSETCNFLIRDHATSQAKITALQRMIKNQIIITGLFFLSTLTYIVFEIIK